MNKNKWFLKGGRGSGRTFRLLCETYENKIAELEKENAELKCECRRCVYSDCPCILSDYGKDRNGICDHFKDVFDEIVELKEENAELKKACDETQELLDKQIEATFKLDKENAELKEYNKYLKRKRQGGIQKQYNKVAIIKHQDEQLTKAKELLERLLITSCNSDVLNLLPNCSEVLRVRVEAEQFLNSEVER